MPKKQIRTARKPSVKKKGRSSAAGNDRFVQKQLYMDRDLAAWLEADRKAAQAESGFYLSWSAHAVSILHKHRKAVEAKKTKRGTTK